MAEIVTGQHLSDHPLIAAMQASNRAKARISELSDESFEQFTGMLRNHRKCGYQRNSTQHGHAPSHC